jgi:hypothetical protein
MEGFPGKEGITTRPLQHILQGLIGPIARLDVKGEGGGIGLTLA